jgi:hypothetical protein
LATLKKLLNAETPESWIPYQKKAYALRNEIYLKLNQPEQAIKEKICPLLFWSTPPILPPW